MPTDDARLSLGLRLREMRSRSSLSLRGAAERSGLSASFIRMVEIGESGISVERLRQLTEAYGAELNDLMGATLPDAPEYETGTEHLTDQPLPLAGPHYLAAAAIDLVLEHGPGRTTFVEELARRLRTAPASILAHYPTDAALLAQAYEFAIRLSGDKAMELWDEADGPWLRLERLVAHLLPGPASDPPMLLWLRIVPRARDEPELADAQEQTYEWARAVFRDVVQGGQADGTMRADADADLVAWQLITMVDGFSLQLLASTSKLDAPQVVSSVMNAAHRLLDLPGADR